MSIPPNARWGSSGLPNFDPRDARILAAVVELQGSVTRTVVGSKVHSGSEEDRHRRQRFYPEVKEFDSTSRSLIEPCGEAGV
jgi:hypothetical protein